SLADTIVAQVCKEVGFEFKGTLLTESGTYHDTLRSVEGCDSFLTLNLTVQENIRDTISARILPNELYQVENQSFASIGNYDLTLTDELGCDRFLNLRLDHYKVYIPNAFSPNFDGVNDEFTVFTGPGAETITEFEIYDRWGGRTSFIPTVEELDDESFPSWSGYSTTKEAPAGLYIYRIKIRFDDGKERLFKGEVMLIR
ncbi:MAG: gliding motility-associated C-terminal domain-containing protein, partial [Bacteroidota bacterium]